MPESTWTNAKSVSVVRNFELNWSRIYFSFVLNHAQAACFNGWLLHTREQRRNVPKTWAVWRKMPYSSEGQWQAWRQSERQEENEPRELLMLWSVCMLDSVTSASKQHTVTVTVEGGGAEWSERVAAIWSTCVRDSARSVSKQKTCNICNTGGILRESEREKKSYGATLNLVLLTDAPYMSHSL